MIKPELTDIIINDIPILLKGGLTVVDCNNDFTYFQAINDLLALESIKQTNKQIIRINNILDCDLNHFKWLSKVSNKESIIIINHNYITDSRIFFQNYKNFSFIVVSANKLCISNIIYKSEIHLTLNNDLILKSEKNVSNNQSKIQLKYDINSDSLYY